MINENIPIIEMKVRSMEHSIRTALTDQELQISEEIKIALERICTPEYLQEVASQEIGAVIRQAIRRALESYYIQGEGQAKIKKALGIEGDDDY